MPRETVDGKAVRYLAESRVRVVSITPTAVKATVRGSDSLYRVIGTAGGWSCDCPAAHGRCSHIAALKRICLKPTTNTPRRTP